MGYSYDREKPRLFTEDGMATVLAIRDAATALLKVAGAVRAEKLLIGAGDSWVMMAAIDYLVERGELIRVTEKYQTPGQHEVFIAGPKLLKGG